MEKVAIKTEFIKLGQVLKLGNLVGQGSDAKILIAEGEVLVNGEVELQRGKKIRPGDIVELKGEGKIQVVAQEE
ncbi:MAG: RNA-binding S4 domain-containing protein [Lachnospiraceae bacterium]|nr:RNA-binding S4 domain-containing protein [Lachnospiraceae bacterium]